MYYLNSRFVAKTYIVAIWLSVVTMLTLSPKSVATEFEECKSPIKLSSTTDWYPYLYRENGESIGIDVTLLSSVLQKMGCTLEVMHFPERRTLFELKLGHFDVGLGASKTIERQENFHYSVHYRHENNRFSYRESDNLVEKQSNLQGIVNAKRLIAVNLAGWYGEELEHAKANYDGFIFSDTVEKRLKMLSFNRVDIVIDDEIVLCSELERLNYDSVKIHPLLLSRASIHYIFNKNSISFSFVEAFNRILNDMRNSGEITSLYSTQLSSQCAQLLIIDQ